MKASCNYIQKYLLVLLIMLISLPFVLGFNYNFDCTDTTENSCMVVGISDGLCPAGNHISVYQGNSKSDYHEIKFNVPETGRYDCEIEIIGVTYGWPPRHDNYVQKYERATILINSKSLGYTSDPTCNLPNAYDGGTCVGCGPYTVMNKDFTADLNSGTNKLKIDATDNYANQGNSHEIKSISLECDIRECSPGEKEYEECGDCGTRERVCKSDYTWGSWGSCYDEGVCSPGEKETEACGDGGTRERTCKATCEWNPWGPCIECETDQECDDGLYCNGDEVCVNNQCEAGTPVQCNDPFACTINYCDENSDSCVTTPDDTVCDDGYFCNGEEYCDVGLGCVAGTPIQCEDDVECTLDACNEDIDACVIVPDNDECDDGLWCNGPETCDVFQGCVGGQDVDCSGNDLPPIGKCDNDPDNIFYTWDYAAGFISQCNEATDSCTEGTYSYTHTCDKVNCNAECEDNNDCPDTPCTDQCIGKDYYDYSDVPNDCLADCTCENNQCANPTIYYNDPRCTECQDHADCDDLDADYCVGTKVMHDEGICKNYECEVETQEVEDCDDGLWCNGDEFCLNAVCYDGTAVDCDDGLYCNGDEYCDEDQDKCEDGTPVDCDDGLWCNGEETCHEASDQCKPGTDVDCSGNDLPSIGKCNNNPDNILYTWDYAAGFDSVCDEGKDECTTGSYSYTHTCDKVNCNAECEDDNDCPDTPCKSMCVGKDWHEYSDVPNDCLADCTCEDNQCGAPQITYNDPRCTQCQDHADCDDLDKDYCVGTKVMHDEGICKNYECEVDTQEVEDCDDGLWCNGDEFCLNAVCYDGTAVDCDDHLYCNGDEYCDEVNDECADGTPVDCDDGLWCNGVETCHEASDQCKPGTDVDCTGNDLPPIGKCNNVPDGIFYTWDYAAGFDSVCNEVKDECTTGSYSYTHTCDIDKCDAECEDDNDCPDTPCKSMCVGKDWHEYSDVPNDCLADCTCEDNQCGAPQITYNDPRCTQCQDHADCDDLDADYCVGTKIMHDEGICKNYVCEVDTREVEDCDDGLYCNGDEYCLNAVCYDGTSVDCSGNDISEIATCFNNPDNLIYTWDFRAGFTSICNEQTDSCTTGSSTLTHTCDIQRCNAECEDDSDCTEFSNGVCLSDCTCYYDKIHDINITPFYSYSVDGIRLTDDSFSIIMDDIAVLKKDEVYKIIFKTVNDGEFDETVDFLGLLYNQGGTPVYVWFPTPGFLSIPGFLTRTLTLDTQYVSPGLYTIYVNASIIPEETEYIDNQRTRQVRIVECEVDGDCDDGVTCTDDQCVNYECEYTPVDSNCDDGLWCNGEETCDIYDGCIAGTPVTCQDSVGCTQDSCNEETDSCDHIADDTICDDGLYCNGDEYCHALLGCQAGTPVNCGDGVDCTIDSCNEDTDSCANFPDNQVCDDGLYCNGDEVCEAGVGCVSGSAIDCSGNNLAEIATCYNNPDNKIYTWDFAAAFTSICNEAIDSCTTGSQTLTHTCDKARCNAQCEDNNDCPETPCQSQCVGKDYYEYSDVPNDCLGDCTCEQNQCGNPTVHYNDPRCTDCQDHGDCDYLDKDYCSGTKVMHDEGVCINYECEIDPQIVVECDNGQYCDGSESCLNANCVAGTPVNCDDGKYCNGVETCDEAQDKCVSGTLVDCSSNDLSPVGRCDNNPDGIYYTWDYAAGYTSQCNEATDSCTSGSYSYTHTCDINKCDAECEDNNDCVDTQCQSGCVGDDYHEYSDVANDCLRDCTCEENQCGSPTVHYNDPRCTECQTDNDCNDLDDDYCEGTKVIHEEGKCSNYVCIVEKQVVEDCDDGVWCNGQETCDNAQCYDGTAVDCDDGLYCTGQETCNEELDECWAGAPIDCTSYDIPPVETCNNNPDNNQYTWDYFVGFNSVCNEVTDSCTIGQEDLSHICKESCGADPECDGVVPGQDDCTELCKYKPPYICLRDGIWGATFEERHEYVCAGDNTYYRCNEEGSGYIHIDVCSYHCSADLACDGTPPNTALNTCDLFGETYLEDYCDENCFAIDDYCESDLAGCTADPECDEEVPGTGDCSNECVYQECYDDSDCDDGKYCNGAETCNIFTKECEAGTPVNCYDGKGCTIDSCNEDLDKCENLEDDSYCDDGLWCNGLETCDASLGCVDGPAVDCDDGQYCNGQETCNEAMDQCWAGAPIDCTSYDLPFIETCNYVPDNNPFTWDYYIGFISTCDESLDQCTTAYSDISHECSVSDCNAECDQSNSCPDNGCNVIYDDYCSSRKLVEYDNDYIMDSTEVSDSCMNDCLADCTCEDCSVDCSPPVTQEHCVIGECGAECEVDIDCGQINCDGGCYEYRNYHCNPVDLACIDCECNSVECPPVDQCDYIGTDDDGDGYDEECGDCDDNDPTIYPGAPEICNEIDDNCNGLIDEGLYDEFFKLSYGSENTGDVIHINGWDTFNFERIDFFHGYIYNQRGNYKGFGSLAARGELPDSTDININVKFEVIDLIEHTCKKIVWSNTAWGTYWVYGIGPVDIVLDEMVITYYTQTGLIDAYAVGEVPFEFEGMIDKKFEG